MSRPAIFLDRDGVINHDRHDYVKCWEELELLPGTPEAVACLAQLGRPVVVVTNQAGIGRGVTTEAAVEDVNARLVAALNEAGGHIDLVLYCPHRPDDGCACRKPQPGLLLAAAERLDLDLRRSYLIGDAESDILAGQQAGCQTILVLTGRGQQQLALLAEDGVTGFWVAKDLAQAVAQIQQASEAVSTLEV
jgi:D-glycero-D-manno-heptose 1,7-bisphosphate phosphatase